MKEISKPVTEYTWMFTWATFYMWIGRTGKTYPQSVAIAPCFNPGSKAEGDAVFTGFAGRNRWRWPKEGHGVTICYTTKYAELYE